MQLLITRETSTGVTTPGQLFLVNGNSKRWLAYTLEDVVRAGAKVHGRTAIPAGTYELRISLSNRFKKELPEVLPLPGHHANVRTDNAEVIAALTPLACVVVSPSFVFA